VLEAQGANLNGAHLEGADLHKAYLEGVDLRGRIWRAEILAEPI
jgi:uncharacterized protein YjbI with pentapeptide repeats